MDVTMDVTNMSRSTSCQTVLCSFFPKSALAELDANGLRWMLQPAATGYVSSYEKKEWCTETKVYFPDKF